MNTRETFEEKERLKVEIDKTKELLRALNNESLRIMDKCPHEIVFKYTDNYPRKMVTDGTYLCPACGKTIRCSHEDVLEKSDFKESRVIPLTNLSLFGSNEVCDAIEEEVRKNMDIYYDYIIPTEDLSSMMEAVLEDKQNRYEEPEKVLKRITKDNK